jgi:hypothetical protein
MGSLKVLSLHKQKEESMKNFSHYSRQSGWASRNLWNKISSLSSIEMYLTGIKIGLREKYVASNDLLSVIV